MSCVVQTTTCWKGGSVCVFVCMCVGVRNHTSSLLQNISKSLPNTRQLFSLVIWLKPNMFVASRTWYFLQCLVISGWTERPPLCWTPGGWLEYNRLKLPAHQTEAVGTITIVVKRGRAEKRVRFVAFTRLWLTGKMDSLSWSGQRCPDWSAMSREWSTIEMDS